MVAHVIWAVVVLALAALVVLERRRGRLSASDKSEVEEKISNVYRNADARTDRVFAHFEAEVSALKAQAQAVDALRKDVAELKRARERDDLKGLRP